MTNNTHRLELAELAYESMALAGLPAFRNIADGHSLAHPGFTGHSYDFNGNGTLVIGMNRGGSPVSFIDPTEHQCLTRIQEKVDLDAYNELSKRSFELLPNWKIWSRNLSLLLKRSDVTFDKIAYIHAVPFRVLDNADLNMIYTKIWDLFTVRQLKVLNPGRVLFAGKQVGTILAPLVAQPNRIVPRTGRDVAWPNHDGVPHAKRVAESHDRIAADAKFWKSKYVS